MNNVYSRNLKLKKHSVLLLLVLFSINIFPQSQWKPAGDKIKTKWAETINPKNVLPEYPRPILERDNWASLNGLWEYAILKTGKQEPLKYDGKILVPFPLESSLSGVQKKIDKTSELWYKRTFSIPSDWKSKNILLHFGAVDWKTDVFLNDIKIGSHTGGYTPFSFDITPYLTSGEQKLVVKVWDPTEDGYQARGKQSNNPEGIWYTAVSGIWQTVWLEPVSEKHIVNIKSTPNIDAEKLTIKVDAANVTSADIIEVIIKDDTKIVSKNRFAVGQDIDISLPNAKLWSPDSPFLYDMEVNLHVGGKVQDHVKSYAAMRKISMGKDHTGIVRLRLNNKDLFQFGLLDQGWWPDGLYTAPSDEALVFDIQKTKDLGYNMIRKHVKVEPARWYTYCDRIGLLVWQDMPNGNGRENPQWLDTKFFDGKEMVRSPQSESDYRKEWKEIIDFLYSYPSIVVWTTFNEAWGQFKTAEITEWTKTYDPSRLVDAASGGNHYRVGDMIDIHHYPQPKLTLFEANTDRATVLGEYGNIKLPLPVNLWEPNRNFGEIQPKNSKDVTNVYIEYCNILKTLIPMGYSAAVFTQTTDVENEINGLITYDRKVLKADESQLKKVNQEICKSLDR